MCKRRCRSARRSSLPDLKLSDDGLYYWDGQQWVSTLSHDGHSRWNGSVWVPVGMPVAPLYATQPRGARTPTGWTRPMQYSVAGWYLIQAIYAVTLPFFMAGAMADYINQVLQQQAALNPNMTPPPADFVSTMTTVMTWGLAFAAAVGVIIAAIVIIGALKRWTWLFYAVLVLLGLSAASFPFTLISAFTTSALSPMKLPVEMTYVSIAEGIPAVALFVWMLLAALRRGPWAMTRSAQ